MVSEHQRDSDLYLCSYHSSVHETTGQPANVLFGRELRISCDLHLAIYVVGEDYFLNLHRRMEAICERFCEKCRLKLPPWSTVTMPRADKVAYVTGGLVWLHNPRRHRGSSLKLPKPWDDPYGIVTRIKDLINRIRKLSNGKARIVTEPTVLNSRNGFELNEKPLNNQQDIPNDKNGEFVLNTNIIKKSTFILIGNKFHIWDCFFYLSILTLVLCTPISDITWHAFDAFFTSTDGLDLYWLIDFPVTKYVKWNFERVPEEIRTHQGIGVPGSSCV